MSEERTLEEWREAARELRREINDYVEWFKQSAHASGWDHIDKLRDAIAATAWLEATNE